MNSHIENIFLGHELLQLIKQQTICSNDIILKAEMPVLSQDLMADAIQRFGQKKIAQYLCYTKKLTSVRSAFRTKTTGLDIKFNLAAGMLATARLGYGETSELVNVAYVELIKRNLKNFTIIHIQSNPNQNTRHPDPFGHGFILLGSQDFLRDTRTIVQKIHRDHEMVGIYDEYLSLHAQIAEIEVLTKSMEGYRLVGEVKLACLDDEIRRFEQSLFGRFPEAHTMGLDRFLKNAVKSHYDLYQTLIQSSDPNMVVLDPFLNFVGTISDYMREQSQYFKYFNYSKIIHVTTHEEIRDFSNHWPHTDLAIEELLSAADAIGLQPCDRSLMDLPLCAYSYVEKTEIPQNENPGTILALNTQGSLRFSGLYTENYQLDAVTAVTTPQHLSEAKAIQNRLQAGNFYQTGQHTFFVIPKVNQGTLLRKIEENFWLSPAKR